MTVPKLPQPDIPSLGPQDATGKGVAGALPSLTSQTLGPLTQQQGGETALIDIQKQQPFAQLIKSITTGKPLDPGEKFILSTISRDIAPNGLLSKVLEQAGEAIVQFTEARQIVQNSLQEQMGKALKELQLSFQPLVAELPEGHPSMIIPAILQNIQPQIRQQLLPLVAESATQTLQNYVQLPTNIPLTHAQTSARHLVTSLIELKMAITPPGKEIQFVIPKDAITVNMPPEELEVVQQTIVGKLTTTQAAFVELFKQAPLMQLNIAPLIPFRDAPHQALMLLNTMSHSERSFLLSFLGIWAANTKAIEQAFFLIPYHQLEEKRDLFKALISSQQTLDTSGRTPSDSEQKMGLLNQMLNAPPSLANFLAILALLKELEGDLVGQSLKGQLIYTHLLYNAARELIQVAFDHPTAEYPTVGCLHDLLAELGRDLEALLPKTPQALTIDTIEKLSKRILSVLQEISQESSKLFAELLVRHPRTLLFLVHTDSPLIQDIFFPEFKPQAIVSTIYAVATHPLFQQYQPLALARMLAEVKQEPTTPLARSSYKIAYKAVYEVHHLMTAEEKEAFQDHFNQLL